jgi:hypothetical protein
MKYELSAGQIRSSGGAIFEEPHRQTGYGMDILRDRRLALAVSAPRARYGWMWSASQLFRDIDYLQALGSVEAQFSAQGPPVCQSLRVE